ncbi:MAG: FkbM family methyltransferase [Cruoricaptor ignavus]|nr:FkbM family methyltransferase [Cruoricaptor ignavus]
MGGGSVLTFEPMKSNYNAILQNLELNNCSKNAEVVNVGLGNENKKVEIFFNDAEMGECSVVFGDDKKNKDTIELVRFDDFAKDRTFSDCCIVKMDIEGNEEAAILGMQEFITREKPLLILELWKDNSSKVTAFLNSLGYRKLHIFWFIEEKHQTIIQEMYKMYNKYGIRYDYE